MEASMLGSELPPPMTNLRPVTIQCAREIVWRGMLEEAIGN
jgi:hypothetical protein